MNHLQPLYIAGRVFASRPSGAVSGTRKGNTHIQMQSGQSDRRPAPDTSVSSDWSSQSGKSPESTRRREDADFAAEKLALLKHLAIIERETGWKTSDRARDLRVLWGLENETAR